MKRFQRSLALAASAVVAGAGLAVVSASPASAATTFSPTTGNDGTQFGFTTDFNCPAGSLELNYAFEGPGSNYATAGEGFAGVDGTPDAGGATITGISVANLRTGTATFGTGPFPQTYTLRAFCVDATGNNLPPVDQGTLAITGQGFIGTTFTLQGVAASTGTTTTVSAAPATANEGSTVTLTANITPATGAAADVDTGSVSFTVTGPGAPVTVGPASVTDGVATATFAAPLIPGNNNPPVSYSVSAAYTAGAGFTGSSSTAPATFQVQDAVVDATTTTLAVTVAGAPITSGGTAAAGAPSSPVVLTGTVTNNRAGGPVPSGACEFRNGVALVGTAPVTPAGTCSLTNNSGFAGSVSFTVTYVPDGSAFTGSASAPFTYTFAGVNVCSLTSGFSPQYLDTAGTLTAPFEGSQCIDPQVFQVEVPAGNLIISTPYTAANPFNMGTLQLNSSGTSYSISAPFGTAGDPRSGVSITDTRPGNLPFTAQASATPFTSGTNTIAADLLSFDAPTARYITGNRLDGLSPATTVATTPITAFSSTPQTFAAGTGPGSVFVTGTMTLDNVPTSVAAGIYTSTVTFTIA